MQSWIDWAAQITALQQSEEEEEEEEEEGGDATAAQACCSPQPNSSQMETKAFSLPSFRQASEDVFETHGVLPRHKPALFVGTKHRPSSRISIDPQSIHPFPEAELEHAFLSQERSAPMHLDSKFETVPIGMPLP